MALHNICRFWQPENNVLVLRPQFFPKSFNEDENLNYEVDGVKVVDIKGIRIPGFEFYFLNPLKHLNEMSFRPDIVVSHMYKSYLWSWRIAQHFKVPFVAGLHGSDKFLFQFKYFKYRFNKCFKFCNAVACRSKTIEKHFNQQFQSHTGLSFLALSGIDPGYIESKEYFIEKFNHAVERDSFDFVTVSNIYKGKNIDQCIKALYKLSQLRKGLKWTYTIVGDGSYRRNLEVLVEKLNLQNNIKFVGWKTKEEVMAINKEKNIFLLVSKPETFGLVYLEAMAKGLIVVGLKGQGIDGVVENGFNGFLWDKTIDMDLSSVLDKIVDPVNIINNTNILKNSYTTICNMSEENVSLKYLAEIKRVINKTHSYR